MRSLGELAIYALLALSAGWIVNHFQHPSVSFPYVPLEDRLSEIVRHLGAPPSQPTHERQMEIVSAESLASNTQTALILDARPRLLYEIGHIPGALSLPREDFEPAFLTLRDVLEAHRRRLLIVYCSDSTCKDSRLVADALYTLGFGNIAIFPEGFEKWEAQGRPTEVSR